MSDGIEPGHPDWSHDRFGGLTASGPTGQTWWQLNALIEGLGLPGTVMDDLICHRPSGTGYVGVDFGYYSGHWAINGDVASALRPGTDLITFVSGVKLRGAPLRSGRSDLSLPELEQIRLHVGALAALIRGMPRGTGRRVRILFGIPHQERRLRILAGTQPGTDLSRWTLDLLKYVSESSLLAEEYFRECLTEMLGDHREHVDVVVHDELRLAGLHLLQALAPDKVPSLTELTEVMRHSLNPAWAYALDPGVQHRIGLPEPITTVGRFIDLAHVVTMAGAAQNGPAIAVGTLDATGDTLTRAQILSRVLSAGAGRQRYGMLQVSPCPWRFVGTAGEHIPDSAALAACGQENGTAG